MLIFILMIFILHIHTVNASFNFRDIKGAFIEDGRLILAGRLSKSQRNSNNYSFDKSLFLS